MRVVARLAAGLLTCAGGIAFAYLAIAGGVAALYGIADDSADDTGLTVFGLIALGLSGAIAILIFLLARFALTGRAGRVGAARVLTIGVGAPLLFLVALVVLILAV